VVAVVVVSTPRRLFQPLTFRPLLMLLLEPQARPVLVLPVPVLPVAMVEQVGRVVSLQQQAVVVLCTFKHSAAAVAQVETKATHLPQTAEAEGEPAQLVPVGHLQLALAAPVAVLTGPQLTQMLQAHLVLAAVPVLPAVLAAVTTAVMANMVAVAVALLL
jgi:hypothetical protein